MSHKPIDERGFAAVAAEVARVEKPLSGTLDQQHVGVERGVIGENGRNGERPNREWPGTAVPCLECPGERTTRDVAAHRNQLGRARSRPDRPSGRKLLDKTPMVLMRMANQDGRRAGPIEGRGQQARCAFGGVQRSPGIEDEAVSVRVLDLDATPTDLLSSAVDRQPNAVQPLFPDRGKR
jgi:hypothetical protein